VFARTVVCVYSRSIEISYSVHDLTYLLVIVLAYTAQGRELMRD